MLSYLKKRKKIILATLLTVIVGAGVFGFIGSRFNIKAARAQDEEKTIIDWLKDPGDTALWLICVVVGWAVAFLGWVLGVLLKVLFWVARYNNFINSPAIMTGWVVIRDLCNIFFIVIFLVMVVSTVLDIEEYSYSRILKKLIIMAVLINFSKVICGVFIDAAQVVMMAFMSSIGQLGARYFTYMLGIDQIMAKVSLKTPGFRPINETWDTILYSYVLALIYMIVTIATVLVLLVVLVQRVVMLWIYVVLSPAAYFLSTFPAGASYSGKWWSEFIKYVTIGPIIAFFLWLSFVSMGNTGNQKQILKDMSKETTEEEMQQISADSPVAVPQIGITEGGSPSHVVKFIIGIALLLGGLMAAQSIGGMAGNFAGSTVKNLQSAGTGTLKGIGKTAAYLPKEYGKRAGYGVADKVLGGLSKAPLISGFAMEGRAKLRMHRESAEEKDTKYLQYLPEQDLDRVIKNYSGKGRTKVGKAMSFLARGQEASKQIYKRAWVEKMKKGDEWGMELNDKRNSKTRALIELAQLARHSVTSSGEDAFRDAELGKLWHDFRKTNVGMIDDNEMRTYYKGGNGTNAVGRSYNYKGLEGADNSEYWRGPDPVTGAARSPDSMLTYTASRLRMPQVFDLHHENFTIDPVTGTNAVLDAIYHEGTGAMRCLSQVRDRGTARQKDNLRDYWEHRLAQEQAGDPRRTSHRILDAHDAYMAANPGSTDVQFFDQLMRNGGLAGSPHPVQDPIGNSRNVTGSSKSLEVKSGITGLDKIEKGRLAVNFSELGLKNVDGWEFEGKAKAEIAKKIRESLSNVDENLAKSVEEKINGLSYLVLHNKEKDMSGRERRATHTHELLHARMSNNVSDDELKNVWHNSMNDEDRGKAREKVKKVYGNDKMSEDAIMKEYFTEGLTNKTRWAVKDPEKKITLDSRAENGLNNLLKSKGSNIKAFTSNITQTRPTKENITQTMASAVDTGLQESIEKLAGELGSIGDGFDAISKVGGAVGDLEKAVRGNSDFLEKNAKEYKDNTSKLDILARKFKSNVWTKTA